MKLIDLTVPIEHDAGRLGLESKFSTPYTFDDAGWQGSVFTMFCHYGTHIDAPLHIFQDGLAIDQAPLSNLFGTAAVIELSDHGREAGISGDTLEGRGGHVVAGDIAILRTGWSDKHWGEEAFWKEGPYLQPCGADWLVARGVKAVVYDFSQEFAVRQPGFGGDDCEIHHKILGKGIYNIEYVRNLGLIESDRVVIVAMPLKLVGLDGSPSRVIALEGVDLPREFDVQYG
ncbi:MAG: cyclase family protein [Pseudomonadota bacterium]